LLMKIILYICPLIKQLIGSKKSAIMKKLGSYFHSQKPIMRAFDKRTMNVRKNTNPRILLTFLRKILPGNDKLLFDKAASKNNISGRFYCQQVSSIR
jgi:hypothetical protein